MNQSNLKLTCLSNSHTTHKNTTKQESDFAITIYVTDLKSPKGTEWLWQLKHDIFAVLLVIDGSKLCFLAQTTLYKRAYDRGWGVIS